MWQEYVYIHKNIKVLLVYNNTRVVLFNVKALVYTILNHKEHEILIVCITYIS